MFFQSGYLATLNYVMVAINEIWFSEENIFPVMFNINNKLALDVGSMA